MLWDCEPEPCRRCTVRMLNTYLQLGDFKVSVCFNCLIQALEKAGIPFESYGTKLEDDPDHS